MWIKVFINIYIVREFYISYSLEDGDYVYYCMKMENFLFIGYGIYIIFLKWRIEKEYFSLFLYMLMWVVVKLWESEFWFCIYVFKLI